MTLLDWARRKLSAPAPIADQPPVLPTWLSGTGAPEEPRVRRGMRISPDAAAQMSAGVGEHLRREDVFRPAKPMPGVVPEGVEPPALAFDSRIAMDYTGWGGGGFGGWGSEYSGALGGDVAWLGFQFLAELSQRPEYRMMSETIAKEMTRRWIKLQATGEDDKTERLAQLKNLIEKKHDLPGKFRRLAELDGFFGRGHLFVDTGVTDDSEVLKAPLILDPRSFEQGSLREFRVVEPPWTYPGIYDSTNPLGKNFYVPTTWYVMAKEVHRSRFMTMIGREMPDLLKPAYSFGGLSISQMAMPYVENWLRTRQSVSDTLHSFSVSGLKTNMSDALNQGSSAAMRARAELFNVTRDNRGLMMLDRDTEDYFNVATPLGTLDRLQAQAQEQLSSISHIPLVILLGITPSGLNASSDGETRAFYSWIRSMQEHMFTKILGRCIKIIQLDAWGEIDPDISFDYEPLWEASEEEKARTKQIEAQTDQIYTNLGAVGPEEVRQKIAADEDLGYDALDLSVPAPGEVRAELQLQQEEMALRQPAVGGGQEAGAPGQVQGDALAHDEDSPPVKRYEFDGIRIGIETPKGQVRESVRGDWRVKMPADYGYIYRTKGADGDRVDCFVGPMRPEQLPVIVIDQHRLDATGAFDEHKVMIGFEKVEDALAAYDASYPGSGPERRRSYAQFPWSELRGWLREHATEPKDT